MSITLKIDRDGPEPIHAQIRFGLERLIARGDFPVGARLPSARKLARSIGVNRNTVAQAYEALCRAGVTKSCVGQGTFVEQETTTGQPDPVLDSRDSRQLDWETLLSRSGTGRVLQTPQPKSETGEVISFTKGAPDPDLFPLDEIRSIVSEVLSRPPFDHGQGQSSHLFEYGPRSGYGPLRELIASRLEREGVDPQKNRVLIINGSSHGLDLVARLLVRSGDLVGVEVPSYSGALNLFHLHDVRFATAPLDSQGMKVAHLANSANARDLKLIYTMPSFQNPCGTTMSIPRRHELLKLSRKHQIPVFEDDPEPELRFEGSRPPSLKALDNHNGVISAGTFSKIAFPGFRIGWLVVPTPLFDPLLALKAGTDISSNLFPQVLFYEFVKRGLLDEHLIHVRKEYRMRRDIMLGALETHLPQEASFTRPEGGLVLWVTLPTGITSTSLLERTARRGVLFTPGHFFAANNEVSGFRLSFASVKPALIERGIRILSEEMKQELAEYSNNPLGRPEFADDPPLV